jgi:AraC-like DNA-binding protein
VNEPFPERLRQLPVRLRPRLGETADSYVCRLARANHLKPSYLHCFVAGPRLWFGKPRLDRLAALAGRSTQELQRAFTDTGSFLLRLQPAPGQDTSEATQAELFFRIQSDAEGRGLTLRTLAERHGVSPRTIRRALDAPRPLPHEVTRRRPLSVIAPVKELIDPLLEEGLAPKEIWIRIIDEHNIATPFTPLINYAKERHLSRERPQGHVAVHTQQP